MLRWATRRGYRCSPGFDGQRYSIAELTEGTKLTRQAVTKHLRVLERVRIVHGTVKGGRVCFNSIHSR